MNRFILTAILFSINVSDPVSGQEANDSLPPKGSELDESQDQIQENATMTADLLESIISEIGGDSVQKSGSAILFEIRGINMICIFDENADRMRVISPIKSYDEVSAEEKDAIMDANFRGALDGRYASSEGILYAAYIHPLSSLSRGQLLSGIFQVASLRVSFGEEYSSGLLRYGGERGTAI